MRHRDVCGLAFMGMLYAGCGYGHDASVRGRLAAAVSRNPAVGQEAGDATASSRPIDFGTTNPFFRELGTNGRRCGTCHQKNQGWTITPALARTLRTDDPLFVFDGSDCLPPGAPNSAPNRNSTEMLNYGNVRIELPVPGGADYTLVEFTDPLDCPDPPGASALRLYRRPLPVANASFLATIMWDGRETITSSLADGLARQANNAAVVHARATHPLGDELRASIVAFETDLFHARVTFGSLRLDRGGAHGGPAYLVTNVLPRFRPGINEPFQPGFISQVFDIYQAWEPEATPYPPGALAESIGRGEVVFNTKPMVMSGVPGLNGPDDPSQAPIRGTCSTCHNSPNVGSHASSFHVDIGVAAPSAGDLDVAHLPTYTFRHEETKRTVTVTDPGRGLVTGKFSDLGKVKVPHLRGLTARAPYFHNGSADTLAAVVEFYQRRFDVQFAGTEETDLVAFLSAL